jgi:hypothetical protein
MENKVAYIAYPNGKREPITDLSMENCRKVVGGYVEFVSPKHTRGRVCFLCNEDGHSLGLPLNPHGCELYGSMMNGHPILGTIIVLETQQEIRRWLQS